MNRSYRFGASCALALFAALALAPAPAVADGDDTALTNLIALASQRLALAEPVARWKWANHQAITDTPRENALLADVEKRAVAANVDPAFARAFFQDQIDASKDVQNALFDTWRSTRPPEGPAPDLATQHEAATGPADAVARGRTRTRATAARGAGLSVARRAIAR